MELLNSQLQKENLLLIIMLIYKHKLQQKNQLLTIIIIQPSRYYTTNPLTGRHTIIAGKDFRKHERIAWFNGLKKLETQLTNEQVGYVIELPGGKWFLDCSAQAMNGECPARTVNSPYGLSLYGTIGGNLASNAKITQSFDI